MVALLLWPCTLQPNLNQVATSASPLPADDIAPLPSTLLLLLCMPLSPSLSQLLLAISPNSPESNAAKPHLPTGQPVSWAGQGLAALMLQLLQLESQGLYLSCPSGQWPIVPTPDNMSTTSSN